MKKIFSAIILIFYLFSPVVSLALELQYPSFMGINLNALADQPKGVPLNQLVAWFYYLIVSISGLAAFVMLVVGGIQWMTSTGDPTKTKNARDKMTSALLGLLIVLSSWLLIRVLNPDLTTLPDLTLPSVK